MEMQQPLLASNNPNKNRLSYIYKAFDIVVKNAARYTQAA